MIINNWYVACEAAELGEEPLAVRMLGCDFVLFRDGQGAAACLSGVCAHRGGDLGRGRLCGSGASRDPGPRHLRCPYHGWEYDASGRVIRMPPLGDDAKPPARARVDSYPVEERWGYLWVFLGDRAGAERPELPDFLPQYGDEENWRMVRLKRDWSANWARVHENLIDTGHVHLVHSFGKHLPEKMTVWPTEKTAWGGRVVQRFPGKAAKPAAAGQTRQPRPESVVTLEFSIIGLIHHNAQQLSSGYDQIIWNAMTPIDAYRTRSFGLHFRNYQMEPKHDAPVLKALLAGLDEDAGVVEHQHPRWAPLTSAGELWMATDQMERTYRDQASSFGRRLGEIDVRRFEDLSRDRVLVVPAPGRRQEPGAWMHECVPLVTHDAAGEDLAVGGMGV
jgi:phenylpropionate dioxygenase-like ring-hydroxylating dioxygenase large terminal subunit